MAINSINLKTVQALAPKAIKPLAFVFFLIAFYFLLSATYYLWLAPKAQPGQLKPQRASNGQQWTWFRAERKPVKKAIVDENVGKTRLRATLKGIIDIGERSVAIIDIAQNRDKSVYKVGDKLSSNATLETIEATRVLIREGGKLNELTMDLKTADIGRSKSSGKNPGLRNAAAGKPLTEVANISSPMLAGISFVQTESGDTGMSLGTIDPGMLEGTDLQGDDVILSAGGTTVEQILASPMSYQSLMRSDSLDITVMRDGQEQVININPRSVAPNVMRMIGKNR